VSVEVQKSYFYICQLCIKVVIKLAQIRKFNSGLRRAIKSKSLSNLDRTYVSNDSGIEGHVIANHADFEPTAFYNMMSSQQEQNMKEKKNKRSFPNLFRQSDLQRQMAGSKNPR
jgi:hypothetical protein